MSSYLAAVDPSPTPVGTCSNYIIISGQKICGKLEGINTIGDVINRVVSFLFPLAGLILFFVIVWGGFDFLTSAGNPEKVKSARSKITSGLVGFFILIFSFAISKLIAYILGFKGFF